MKTVHSYWAYILLAVLIFTVVNAAVGLIQKKEFTHKDFRLGLFTLIATHIQLLIGLGWYFMSPWYKILKADASTAMGEPAVRLLAVEHPLMMIVAIVLITMGWSKHKKVVKSESKFKTFAIFYGLGLVIILSRIPWSNWFQNL
ncbi:hypothetical protein [Tenacibaculum sp. IB213877]|uniref:hypothetical protein n=1 Tax=Tenacibaculum sp. IB213877 TaxID=3097351 RepID=UPI002A5A819B|nr:hypothetical protein [Tenacibaculum sp. IB213877]MDY0781328.1 hypothetical protein [Tenacibaculum sp. IB213877]